ncbi:MAG: efflux RND transporter periplasmic adaptor subunit [Nitrospinae bacterium]|nr:efflux RND transporter periplasmic adaptor subunit [Nitrospinota bacterium]
MERKDTASSSAGPGVTINAATAKKMGIRLATVKTMPLSRKIKTFGSVNVDETSIVTVTPYVEGWIKKLYANTVGVVIKPGGAVYEIYSPDLVQRQREYVEILIRRDTLGATITEMSGQNAEMMASLARERWRAREKLLLAGIDEPTMKLLEDKRRPIEITPVRSDKGGIVTSVSVREGAYVNPMNPVATLAGLSRLWVDIVIYRDQLGWLEDGAKVTIHPAAAGNFSVEGTLKLASPLTDPASQTLRARVIIGGGQKLLAPGMQVNAFINAQTRNALAAPVSALIRDGRGTRAMLSKGNGRFVPVPVATGISDGENIEVTAGLAEGDMVAVNGQFLLDSASSLNDAAERMRQGAQ